MPPPFNKIFRPIGFLSGVVGASNAALIIPEATSYGHLVYLHQMFIMNG